MALADPLSLAINPANGYLSTAHNESWVMSTLLGQTTHFSSTGIRQICVTPYTHGWYRFAAVLAEVCGHDTLFFQSFRGGITFGTNRFESNGIPVTGKPKKGEVAPVKGTLIGKKEEGTTAVHNFSGSILTISPVPVYDGRNGFQLGNYWAQPYPGAVVKGSTVMLLFSVRKGNLAKGMAEAGNLPVNVEFAIYLNLLAVVVLAEPEDPFSEEPSLEGPAAFGVDSVVEFPDPEEGEPVEEEGEDDNEDEELEESFL